MVSLENGKPKQTRGPKFFTRPSFFAGTAEGSSPRRSVTEREVAETHHVLPQRSGSVLVTPWHFPAAKVPLQYWSCVAAGLYRSAQRE